MNSEIEDIDRFLFAQLRSGKEDAFDFIFRKYYKVLTIQAIRIVHDQDSAQSLVQDCFIRLWEKRNKLDNIEDLYSYLFFMVRNRCIDHLREQKRRQLIPISNPLEFQESNIEDNIDANDLSSHLWHAIANLPDRCRKAFEFSRIEGLSYSEIAVKMGITQKAVEALISRSLKLLRENLVNFLSTLIF